ncbi:hypothetical protein TNCV_1385441 [Trichonephila clavipes]|nr:hypothetical protein TNCV_1385441 [Trichonephila clavipes]
MAILLSSSIPELCVDLEMHPNEQKIIKRFRDGSSSRGRRTDPPTMSRVPDEVAPALGTPIESGYLPLRRRNRGYLLLLRWIDGDTTAALERCGSFARPGSPMKE